MLELNIYDRFTPALAPPVKEKGEALYFIFSGSKLLVKIVDDRASIPVLTDIDMEHVNMASRLYLGRLDEQQCYCAEAAPQENNKAHAVKRMDFRELRSLLGMLEEQIFLIAGRAFHLLNWVRMNKYCGRCGNQAELKKDERVMHCPKCDAMFYPRISPAIIVAVTKEDKILLAHNKNFRANWYSVIAGFVEPGETFEECVGREVQEEVGIRVKNIKYFGSQPWPFPDSLMIGFTAEYDDGEIKPDGVEIDDAGWFSRGELPNIPSKFSIAGRLIEWFSNKEIIA